jgi:8-oxo-dGTP diphosphatase
MNPAAPPQRKVTRVAVGVLVRGDGCVLLADRPAGKPYAGYWEFPGGKIEPGESVVVALERELHEELGIDIGRSVPWVTFEFDYPHAYVELQFRLVREWCGEPHAREGQQLRFVDPACELPQPVLPAALPALRWLLLPRMALVVGPLGAAALLAGSKGSRLPVSNSAAKIVVVDGDWRNPGQESVFEALRSDPVIKGSLLLASGPGAARSLGADGVVVEANALAEAGGDAGGWRGAWVGSVEELQVASNRGCDFVLVRSSALAGKLRAQPAALPALFQSDASLAASDARDWHGQGCWIDLRLPAAPSGGTSATG